MPVWSETAMASEGVVALVCKDSGGELFASGDIGARCAERPGCTVTRTAVTLHRAWVDCGLDDCTLHARRCERHCHNQGIEVI